MNSLAARPCTQTSAIRAKVRWIAGVVDLSRVSLDVVTKVDEARFRAVMQDHHFPGDAQPRGETRPYAMSRTVEDVGWRWRCFRLLLCPVRRATAGSAGSVAAGSAAFTLSPTMRGSWFCPAGCRTSAHGCCRCACGAWCGTGRFALATRSCWWRPLLILRATGARSTAPHSPTPSGAWRRQSSQSGHDCGRDGHSRAAQDNPQESGNGDDTKPRDQGLIRTGQG